MSTFHLPELAFLSSQSVNRMRHFEGMILLLAWYVQYCGANKVVRSTPYPY